MTDLDLTAHRVVVPDHVVFRDFPNETVVLNLASGQYHGLNSTAGKMLDAVTRLDSIDAAAQEIATSFAQPRATVDADIRALLDALMSRGLVELDPAPPQASRG